MLVLNNRLHFWVFFPAVGTGLIVLEPVAYARAAEDCCLAGRTVLRLFAQEGKLLTDHTLDECFVVLNVLFIGDQSLVF